MHYTKEQIDEANGKSIAEFLECRGESLKRVGSEWLWEKNQIWIRGSEWYTHYDQRGGHSIRFVMEYFNLTFPDAIAELLGCSVTARSVIKAKEKDVTPFIVPKPYETMNRVYAYLLYERFIDRDIISFFAHERLLYEDDKFHNCVFVGKDENGNIRHIHRRGTNSGSTFKNTEAGSDKNYSFHHIGTSEWLFVFEAPIDMLAFQTLHKTEWQRHSYVALCCVAEHAMLHQLQANLHLKKVVLCLDNDSAGAKATERLKRILAKNGYTNVRTMLPQNKDWDEDLKVLNGKEAIPSNVTASDETCVNLCHELSEEAQMTKKPVQLYAVLRDVATNIMKTPEQELHKQCRHLTVLLFLFAKDECRKSEAAISWSEIESRLADNCHSSTDGGDTYARMRQLNTNLNEIFEFYESGKCLPSGSADAVLNNILPSIENCIRLIHYLERKDKK